MSAGDQVRTLVEEQIHHGAEIALLRDLFVRPHTDHYDGRPLVGAPDTDSSAV
jgi:hypothetical protein